MKLKSEIIGKENPRVAAKNYTGSPLINQGSPLEKKQYEIQGHPLDSQEGKKRIKADWDVYLFKPEKKNEKWGF